MDFGLIPTDSSVYLTYKDRQSWLDRRRCHEPNIKNHKVNNSESWAVFLKTWKRASLASMASCCTYNLTVLQDGKVYDSVPFFWYIKVCNEKTKNFVDMPSCQPPYSSQGRHRSRSRRARATAKAKVDRKRNTTWKSQPQLQQKSMERGIQHDNLKFKCKHWLVAWE